MSITKIIFFRFAIIVLAACEAGLIWWIGNRLLENYIVMDSSNRYLFLLSLLDIITTAFPICFLSYLIYLVGSIVFEVTSFFLKILLSIFSISLIFFIVSGFGGAYYNDPYVLKNLVAFLITGISIPFIEKAISRNVGRLPNEE
jgi:hypothetical protein